MPVRKKVAKKTTKKTAEKPAMSKELQSTLQHVCELVESGSILSRGLEAEEILDDVRRLIDFQALVPDVVLNVGIGNVHLPADVEVFDADNYVVTVVAKNGVTFDGPIVIREVYN